MSSMNLIFACDINGAIGKDNKLLWHISEDLKFFKDITSGSTVVMGRKTWESLPMYPKGLPNRKNIVLSKSLKQSDSSHVTIVNDVQEILQNEDSIFVIGGAEIYKLLLPYCEFVYRTLVKTKIKEADTFFDIGEDFEMLSSFDLETNYDIAFQLLKRKKQKTTKECPECGNTELIMLSSLNQKVCINHQKNVYIDWFLEQGQKKLL